MRTFIIIGGDRRYRLLAELLQTSGHRAEYRALTGNTPEAWEGPAGSMAVLPILRNGRIPGAEAPELPRLGWADRVFLGGAEAPLLEQARALGLRVEDYSRRESFLIANAAVTAEAAVHLAAEALETGIRGRRCLVLGYGRIGTSLCRDLGALGAEVFAAARSEEARARIHARGFRALDLGSLKSGALSGRLTGVDAVFNTVPAPVLDEAALRALPPGCLVMELASRPGFDFAAAEALGLAPVAAPGLPGRRAPRAAAAALRDVLEEIIREGDPV